ncbi:FAD-dependent oxidoreductase [soil metagenome]
MRKLHQLCVFACSSLALVAMADEAKTYDIVVYGGTSGGVTAGIQAARMGKSVVIIEPTKFLGGLTTGGLGATDIGNKQAIGGMSREFYHRVWQYYQKPETWKDQTSAEYFTKKPHGGAGNEETMWTFEPHVATKIYDDMIAEAKVPVIYSERLDLKSGVKKEKEGTRITEIVMESGKRFAAKMFIDATYEGDLMAKAGVTYHVGREANAVYGETINGVQAVKTISHQFIKQVDPYIKPGDPKSGVLFGIQTDGPGEDGSGDKRVQAYNYRMCTTDVPENRLDWPKPANYDPAHFELALRNVEAGDERISWNPVGMPNRKTDTNNNFAVSTDFIGMNYEYPDADYATRDRIVQEHKDYQMGLIWTYANDPRVPEKVRAAFKKFGMAKDEFLDNGHWPRQLYVREARRMISDYVMSEKNCRRVEVVEDSVGMGAYNMDSHNCQRYITKEGSVRNEGDVQIGTKPYPISFRCLYPKADQCTNLLVPVAMSASHIAYGSIRMEPVFMVLGQSAASAAALAIDAGVEIQKLPYASLKVRLDEDKQVLDLIPAKKEAMNKAKLEGVVLDDSDAQLTGFVSHSSTSSPFIGEDYAHDGNTEKGRQRAVFKTKLPEAGKYEVRVAYTALKNRASNVPVVIHSADGVTTVKVDQRKAPTIEGLLFPVGVFQFAADKEAVVEITNEGTDGHVIVDGVQWIKK